MAAPQPSTQAKRPLCISDEERAELLAKYRKLTPPSPAQERAEQLAKYRKLMPLPKAQPATEASTSTEALGTHAASDHLSTFTFSAKLSSSGWPSHPARWEAKLKQLGPDDAQYAYPYELPTSVDALPEWLRKKMDAEVKFQRQIEDACDVAEAEQAAKDEADPSRGLPGYWDEGYPSDDDQPRYEDGDWPSHLLGDEESADAIFCGRWEDLELTIEVSRGRHVTRLYRGSVDFQAEHLDLIRFEKQEEPEDIAPYLCIHEGTIHFDFGDSEDVDLLPDYLEQIEAAKRMRSSAVALTFALGAAAWTPPLHPRPPARLRQRAAAACADSAPGVVVGIDLGTTSSSIAVVRDGRPVICATAGGGKPSLPSRVQLAPDGDAALVGHAAPPSAITSAKRVIGRSYEDARRVLSRHSGLLRSLEQADDGAAMLRCGSSGNTAAPEAIGAHVIGALLDAAEAECGVRAERAVIGVPAHFLEAQREATLLAAELAGIEKVKLIEEPVAAALAYTARDASAPRDELVCVFDLGGGTLDVSLLMVGGGTVEILSSAGEPWLGGDDFDARLSSHIAKEAGLLPSAAASAELLALARRAKEQLTVSKRTEVELTAELLASLPADAVAPPAAVVEAYDGEEVSELGEEEEHGLSQEEVDFLQGFGYTMRGGGGKGGSGGGQSGASEPASSAAVATPSVATPSIGTIDQTRRRKERRAATDGASVTATGEGSRLVSISRSEIGSICKELLETMRAPLVKAADACQVPLRGAARSMGAADTYGASASPMMKGRRIQRVLLVGAASRMPAVATLVEEMSGIKPDALSVKPELAVALGAAVQAGVLEGSVEQLDVFSPLEAAMLRGLSVDGSKSQRERKKRR